MATSYADEISAFSTTYAWATAADVSPLREQVEATANRSLIAVGSGGSWTAAHFAAYLHQTCTPHLSQAVTPLQINALDHVLHDLAVMLFSARGRNPDILSAAKVAAEGEPRELTALLFSGGSPLRKLLDRYQYAVSIELIPDFPRDGFLSTNSLLAALLVLYRAYAAVFSLAPLPPSFKDLSNLLNVPPSDGAMLDRTLLVLFGSDTAAGAYDLESKMSEAALAHVLLSDHRDFAHGRHYWLAKRPQSSAIVAFSSKDDDDLVTDTLGQLPRHVPQYRIACTASGAVAGILSVVGAMQFVSSFVTNSKTNVSRPGVPSFGRRLYHSKALARSQPIATLRDIAIQRKISATAATRPSVDWEARFAGFVDQLQGSNLSGLVIDYDGTLCGAAERYTGIGDIALQLRRLVRLGLPIGIATGRGDSVADDLRSKLDRRDWSRVLIGYYNGGHIRRLDEHLCISEIPDNVTIDAFAVAVRAHPALQAIAEIKMRPCQITIRAKRRADIAFASLTSTSLLARLALDSLEVVQSSHSIDVIPRGHSKLAVVERLRSDHGSRQEEVLCVGDKGLWPGNDYRLLQTPLSLSVDEVSPDPDTCWNLAPAGWRGPQATYRILSRIDRVRKSRFGIDLTHES